MNVTQTLMTEHQFILKYNNVMVQFSDRLLETKSASNLEQFGPYFTDFIQEFADKFHHSKEEDILFQELIKPGVLSHCNPIPVMLHEHDEGRTACEGLIRAIKESNFEAFKEFAHLFQDVLEAHIFKEDNVLYPMAEEALGSLKKEEINHLYSKAEEEQESDILWVSFKEKLAEIEELLTVTV